MYERMHAKSFLITFILQSPETKRDPNENDIYLHEDSLIRGKKKKTKDRFAKRGTLKNGRTFSSFERNTVGST